MAKDGTMRGGARVGSGRKSKALTEKIGSGLAASVIELPEPEELACLGPHVDMLGVNNRHLGSFHTDVRTSFDMLEALAALPSQPEPPLLVSESGLSDAQTVRQLRRAGYRGFLIGENFMKSPHPGKALSAFLQNLNGPCV